MPGELPFGAIVSDRYRIIAVLGQGGMGLTYRAWDLMTSRPVVLKHPRREMLERPGFAERFNREARMMAALSHPHVVPITTIGEQEGLPYLTMPFLPGGSLLHHRARDKEGRPKPMLPSTLHLWLPQIAEALDYVHSSGIVHRDVKPANVFFNGFWHAYLGDFGIAKIVGETSMLEKEQTLTATSMMVGTHEYMAPEMFAPKATVTGKADQYALAVMVYELLAGRRPFTGDKAHLIVEVTTQRVPSLGDMKLALPESLEAAVHRGLAKRPEERFESCGEFVRSALADVAGMQDEPGLARLACPSCGNVLKVKDTVAGRLGRCPRCHKEMIVATDFSALWLLGEEATKSAPMADPPPPPHAAAVTPQSERPDRDWELPSVIATEQIGGGRPRLPRWLRKPPTLALATVAVLPLFLAAAMAFDWSTSSLRLELRKLQVSLRSAETQAESLRVSVRQSDAAMEKLKAENVRLLKENAELRLTSASASLENAAAQPPPPPGALLNSINMPLQRISPGTFTMGDTGGQADETPHVVTLKSPFYIGVHEVTNAQWRRVMGQEPSRWTDDDRPVQKVSWEDAMEFCRRLSKLPGERAAGRLYRLPTEAEWEYACRAGTKTRYSFGDDAGGLEDSGWFKGNSDNHPHPVGQKKPNRWGLHDMSGNGAAIGMHRTAQGL